MFFVYLRIQKCMFDGYTFLCIMAWSQFLTLQLGDIMPPLRFAFLEFNRHWNEMAVVYVIKGTFVAVS